MICEHCKRDYAAVEMGEPGELGCCKSCGQTICQNCTDGGMGAMPCPETAGVIPSEAVFATKSQTKLHLQLVQNLAILRSDRCPHALVILRFAQPGDDRAIGPVQMALGCPVCKFVLTEEETVYVIKAQEAMVGQGPAAEVFEMELERVRELMKQQNMGQQSVPDGTVIQ